MDRYGEEIIVSEELKQTINDIKPLPKEKIKEGFSILNYIFIGNIIYFGYQNQCYNMEQMRYLFEQIHSYHGCYRYQEFDDYIALINQVLDKMGLTEDMYQLYKEECYKDIRMEMLKRYVEWKKKCREPISDTYSLKTRNTFAYLNYYFDNFVPFTIVEDITDKGFYNAVLTFEELEDYQKLQAYMEQEYEIEYEEASNKPSFVFQKLFEPLFPQFQFTYDEIRKEKATIYVENLKREETDITENLDYEDDLLVYSNNIVIMMEIALQCSSYYCKVEEKFEKGEEEW